MSFSFKVKKPTDSQKTLENVKKEVVKYKGSFVGDEKEGTITVSGVRGTYVLTDDTVEITITEKPSLLPEFVIKSYIEYTIKKCSV